MIQEKTTEDKLKDEIRKAIKERDNKLVKEREAIKQEGRDEVIKIIEEGYQKNLSQYDYYKFLLERLKGEPNGTSTKL